MRTWWKTRFPHLDLLWKAQKHFLKTDVQSQLHKSEQAAPGSPRVHSLQVYSQQGCQENSFLLKDILSSPAHFIYSTAGRGRDLQTLAKRHYVTVPPCKSPPPGNERMRQREGCREVGPYYPRVYYPWVWSASPVQWQLWVPLRMVGKKPRLCRWTYLGLGCSVSMDCFGALAAPKLIFCFKHKFHRELDFFFFWQNWYAHVKHLGSDKEWLNKLLRLMGKELYVKNAVVTLLSIKYSLISLYYKFIFCRYIWEGVWHSQGLCSFSQQITVKTCHVMSQMEFSPSRQAVLCELHLK